MPLLVDYYKHNDDVDFGDLEEVSSGSHEYREIIIQQSVTMLAYMDKNTYNSTVQSEISEPKLFLGFFFRDFTILIGALIGATGLIFVILLTLLIWHCCRRKRRIDKAYCLDNSSADECTIKNENGNIIQSDSLVFLGNKTNQVSTCAIGIKNDLCQSILTRSQSVPLKEDKELPKLHSITKPISKKRPLSQPVHLSAIKTGSYSPKRANSVHPRNYCHLENVTDTAGALPSIPEMAFHSSEESHILYASCNALDGPNMHSSLYSTVTSNSSMKTRSLPLWGRSHPRPLSTEDDLTELYAKVSFSKKRKNRMRSDSAAAIAINKSRSPYLALLVVHKDTDSLVDNEAVVVYDERTAL